jgi:RNA polymerase sigma-70 factor, ECF subfamily
LSDESLTDRLKDPSQKRMAFHELVVTYQEKLYWYIRKIVVDHDDTDDILQNVLVKVWNNIETFREESSLYTWLFRIATNESLTFLAKKKRQRGLFVKPDDDYLIGKFEADEYFDGDEIHKKLMEAVLKLPDRQRLVFNMKYFDGMKFTEIAEILKLTTGALKASYHIAVKKIEEELSNKNLNN